MASRTYAISTFRDGDTDYGTECELLPAAEILRRIEQRNKIKSGIRNMALFGRLLFKNNVTKKHTKTGNYYHVIELL